MFSRKHYRANGDAPEVKNTGELDGKSVKMPFHVLWRWENDRKESVTIEGRGKMSAKGNFAEYAVCFEGFEIGRESARTAAESMASELRREIPNGYYDGLDRIELMSIVKHFETGENVAHMSETELRETYEETDTSKFGDYETEDDE